MDSTIWKVEQARRKALWAREGRSPATVLSYQQEIRRYFQWCDKGGHKSLSSDSADLYIDELLAKGGHMARSATRALKSYGKFLASEDEANRFAKLKLPKEPEPSTTGAAAAASEGDLVALLDDCQRSLRAADKLPSHLQRPARESAIRDAAIITILACEGMRRSEVANLRMEDIDLVERSIQIRKGKTKAARRLIRMRPPVQGALLKYIKCLETPREPGDWLWTSSTGGGQFTASGIGQTLDRRGKRAGVDARAHAFRRMYASEWMERGGSETGLMRTAGWTTTAMVARYTKGQAERLAMDESDRLFADD